MTGQTDTTEVLTTDSVKGKLRLSISDPTPMWATWIFRIVFLLTTGAAIWVAGTKLIATDNKIEIMLALKTIDFMIWGLGKLLGIQKPDIEVPS